MACTKAACKPSQPTNPLARCPYRPPHPADLWQCTALTRLVLRGSTLEAGYGDEAEVPELPALEGARLPNLRALCLHFCAVQPSLVGELVAAAPQLTALALGEVELLGSGAGGGARFIEDLALLAKLTALQELDLSALEVRLLQLSSCTQCDLWNASPRPCQCSCQESTCLPCRSFPQLHQEHWDKLLPALKPLAGLRILR